MAERIVSPGVFTRERDLSFLPQGIGEIGAAIVGPTLKGPSFVPTVVTSFSDFERIFGSYTTDYYTPYTVREYLKSAGSVTIVKVGHLGGYKVSSFNLIISGSGKKEVVATFLPAVNNSSGAGSISGSLSAAIASGDSFDLTLNGANATASVSGLTVFETGTGASNFIGKQLPDIPTVDKIGSTSAPVYMYKHFRSSISASFSAGIYSATGNATMSIENLDDGMNFNSGGDTVDANTFVTTNNGSKDAMAARTPFIQSQKIGGTASDLFRIYTRAEGTGTNEHYVVIRDVKRPQNSNSSPDYAEFGLQLFDITGNLLESYSKLNLDPDSANFIAKVIGDQFQSVNSDGEVTVYGYYPNLSKYIRVGDYIEETFSSNKNLQPMGFAAVLDVVKTVAGTVPTASFARKQVKSSDTTTYKVEVPYGYKIGPHFLDSELHTNKAYLAPVPHSETAGGNAAFNLEDMVGFGDKTTSEFGKFTNFTTNASNLNISASVQQLKFAVPFQHGFDGNNPAAPLFVGNQITAGNTMGFDCSSTTTSGSVSYKRAINAVSNPDDIDINMLVTPGIVHKLHPAVTNHAIDKIEERADAFYVMDGSAYGDNVATAVSNVKTLDTNYVATYYPWVKIDDPSTGTGVWVPPSVVIPGVIAFTDRVAHEWFAPAGLNRGGLASVRMAKKKLTHTDRDQLYDGRVNPIASFPGQGVVVFGQKTLQAKPSALDRINVRRLLIRLKKFIASSSRFLVFEQNDSSTRARFLNIVNPFLESVQSNSGLSAFKVVMDDSNNTPDVIDRNQLVGQIFIQPTRTAEFIVLDFTVLPTGAAFPE